MRQQEKKSRWIRRTGVSLLCSFALPQLVLVLFSCSDLQAQVLPLLGPGSQSVNSNLSLSEFLQLVLSSAFQSDSTANTATVTSFIAARAEFIVWLLLLFIVAASGYLLYRMRQLRLQLKSLSLANKEIARQKQKFETLFEFSHHGCAVSTLDGRYLLVNRAFCQRLGKEPEEIIGKTPLEAGLFSDVDDSAEFHSELLAKGFIPPREIIATKASGVAYALYSCCLIEFDGGPAVYTMLMDISDQKRQEKTLKANEESFTRLFRAAPIPMAYAFDADGYRATTWNDAWYRTFGYSKEEADGRSGHDIGLWANPEDRKDFVSGVRDQNTAMVKEVELRCKDGSIRQCEVYGRFIGKPGQQILAAAYLDVTERRRAEEEREKLQKQLALSQRLESVGQLAGGVAHDYNNMLGVILGHVELAQMKAGEENPLSKHLDEIQKAARKSADLTMQLLAFARKQTISPVVVDLNTSVSATLEMVRWLIGENVELLWLPGEGKYLVKIDPSQFDQILVNLCVNARDAISGTGKITIETGTVALDEAACAGNPYMRPGRYALLSVADTGCGMDKMVQTRIFDPFFTTKSLGQGTGLGLATVYGIVKQNNGFINVYSEPGQGTVFKLYFPLEEQDAVEGSYVMEQGSSKGKGEIVLVVEDEDSLLEINTAMLVDLGYQVIPAGLPGEALAAARQHNRIDLLITDVVMPEMNGRQLEQAIREIHPHIKCLFMSGYTSNVISNHGILEKGVSFIQKPFSMQRLSRKVREALESKAG